jgi:hypothetical protein
MKTRNHKPFNAWIYVVYVVSSARLDGLTELSAWAFGVRWRGKHGWVAQTGRRGAVCTVLGRGSAEQVPRNALENIGPIKIGRPISCKGF